MIAGKYGFQMLSFDQQYVLYHHVDPFTVIPKIISYESCGNWSLKLAGKDIVKKQCEVLKHLPDIFNTNSADVIFSAIQQANICEGNTDFPSLIKKKLIDTGEFEDNKGSLVGQMQTRNHFLVGVNENRLVTFYPMSF